MIMAGSGWCEGRDSNPHSLRRWNLNPVRLPIPPPSRVTLQPLAPFYPIHPYTDSRAPCCGSSPIPVPVDHYENFPVASWLLPRPLREPVAAIYAFARSADDIADEGELSDAERCRQLAVYAQELEQIGAGMASQQPLFQRLQRNIVLHQLPLAPFADLLDAFGQDIVKKRYADFAELLDYCRRSANPVGRLLLRLWQADSAENLRRSDAICTALQLINHWQDVAGDLARGRIYLPQEDMQRFGVDAGQLTSATQDAKRDATDANWRALLAFEVARARTLMLSGAALGSCLPGRIGLELRLIIAGGLRILEKIEAVDYDVFRRRPVLRALDWPLLLWRAAMTPR